MKTERRFVWIRGELREVKDGWLWLFRLLRIGYDLSDHSQALIAVGNLSGADVVEVVRCKDCIHRPFSTEPGETSGFAVEAPDCICPCYNPDDGYYSWVPDDAFFCADGKRKEGRQ